MVPLCWGLEGTGRQLGPFDLWSVHRQGWDREDRPGSVGRYLKVMEVRLDLMPGGIEFVAKLGGCFRSVEPPVGGLDVVNLNGFANLGRPRAAMLRAYLIEPSDEACFEAESDGCVEVAHLYGLSPMVPALGRPTLILPNGHETPLEGGHRDRGYHRMSDLARAH